ncbi:MAG: hypothetical protein PHO29_04230 [Acetobacterium sp.]|nr:hypothetical protein [Acetobacterium sp.]
MKKMKLWKRWVGLLVGLTVLVTTAGCSSGTNQAKELVDFKIGYLPVYRALALFCSTR